MADEQNSEADSGRTSENGSAPQTSTSILDTADSRISRPLMERGASESVSRNYQPRYRRPELASGLTPAQTGSENIDYVPSEAFVQLQRNRLTHLLDLNYTPLSVGWGTDRVGSLDQGTVHHWSE